MHNSFFFSSRRRHTRYWRDWSSDVCSSDLKLQKEGKDLIVTLQEANRANYFLASYAKEIVMPPVHAASSNISPYHYEELYWKSLLDRFGITIKIGRAHV